MTSGVVPAFASDGEVVSPDPEARRILIDTLLEELSKIPGAALTAVFDREGVCRSLRRSPLICAFGTYRVLADVSDIVPGRSSIAFDVDGRTVLTRRLCDGDHAVIALSGAADVYATEVRFSEAVSGHALRASGAEPIATPFSLVSMTIPPPANASPSELPPLEASLVLTVGSLADLYRDVSDEAAS